VRFCSIPFNLKRARAEPRPAGVCFRARMVRGALAAHIDEILGERADDAVTPRHTPLRMCLERIAVSITPHAEALMTAENAA